MAFQAGFAAGGAEVRGSQFQGILKQPALHRLRVRGALPGLINHPVAAAADFGATQRLDCRPAGSSRQEQQQNQGRHGLRVLALLVADGEPQPQHGQEDCDQRYRQAYTARIAFLERAYAGLVGLFGDGHSRRHRLFHCRRVERVHRHLGLHQVLAAFHHPKLGRGDFHAGFAGVLQNLIGLIQRLLQTGEHATHFGRRHSAGRCGIVALRTDSIFAGEHGHRGLLDGVIAMADGAAARAHR